MCSAVNTAKDLRGINTAAASVLLRTPILKNIMGIYGLTDASHHNIKKLLQKKGIEGSIVLYVGKNTWVCVLVIVLVIKNIDSST